MRFGQIIIQYNFSQRVDYLLETLRISGKLLDSSMLIEGVTSGEFEDTALAFQKDLTIISDTPKSYLATSLYPPKKRERFDSRLSTLSKWGDVLCFHVDDTSGTAGFAYYQKGIKIRTSLIEGEEIILSEGSPLPEEKENTPIDAIFVLAARQLGMPYDQYFQTYSPEFRIYEREGF